MTETRVVLVTGAGSGMGRATAEVFLEHGWTVLALDVAPVEIDASGGRLVPITADVRDREVLDTALSAHVPDLGGSIHAVANVAGIYPPSTLETTTAELFHEVFDVNVLGVINVTAATLPYLPEGSAIVNFASVDGFAVSPGQLVYGASKAAVIMLTAGSIRRGTPRPGGCRPPQPRSRSGVSHGRRRSPTGSGSWRARAPRAS
jgi:NAD(P)-dependent dehydrogenase (short-subunit alcohol dehydrogenase family)